MRYYIQQTCLGVAIVMHFTLLALQLYWPMWVWAPWMKFLWVGVFAGCALTGIALACDWIPRHRKVVSN
jgi:hypothetical protein